MKKRFCDVCEGEVEQGLALVYLDQGMATIMVHAKNEGHPAPSICQSCIIEAIGKMYVEMCGCTETVCCTLGPDTKFKAGQMVPRTCKHGLMTHIACEDCDREASRVERQLKVEAVKAELVRHPNQPSAKAIEKCEHGYPINKDVVCGKCVEARQLEAHPECPHGNLDHRECPVCA